VTSGRPDTQIIANGISYTAGWKYDTRYPGMDPIKCFVPTTTTSSASVTTFCVVRFGNLYGFPFFNHYGIAGSSSSYPSYVPHKCACNDGTSSGTSESCNAFDFLSGFIIFGSSSSEQMAQFSQSFTTLNVNVNDVIYNATYASANLANGLQDILNAQLQPGTEDSKNFQTIQSSAWRKTAYSFCTNGCKGILTVHSFDSYNFFVNPYAHQLASGSCNDSFSLTDAAW
jgi:hypothetical protein